jgi:phage replication-related protein YjqB (UPF0714/DUF867 family)
MLFADLLAHPNVTEVCELRNRFGFMAFHGGNLERGTDEIASIAAERSGASFYGVVQQFPLREHLPSSKVTPDASPKLAAFLDHVEMVIAVHGYGREGLWTSLLLGGGNRQLASLTASHLRSTLDDFTMIDQIEHIPSELRGLHPDNPANRPRRGGVQIELPPRVRGLTPHSAGMERIDGRIRWTNDTISAFVAAATEAASLFEL